VVDDQEAQLALLRVLTHALRADQAARRLRVRVLDHAVSPQAIAQMALGGDEPPPRSHQTVLEDEDGELSYENWRTQVLGLATFEF